MGGNILITAKVSPDIDGIACGIAYRELLVQSRKNPAQEITAAFQGVPHYEARYACERLDVIIESLPATSFSEFIMVDFSESEGLPDIVNPQAVTKVIDHREFFDPSLYPNANYVIKPVGAAASIITNFYRETNKKIHSNTAKLLALAIASNTFYFLANVTTVKDKKMFNWLKQQSGNPAEVDLLVSEVLDYKSQFALNNPKEALLLDGKPFAADLKEIRLPVLHQLEVADLSTFRKLDWDRLFAETYPERENQLLIIHGVKQSRTEILANNANLKRLLLNYLGNKVVSDAANWLCLDKIYMRKDIIKFIKAV